ncbi:zinc finger CCCH domain-containing protein 13-like isoform X2 [Daphnia pulex]|uniref:zinc finger CCCH domain-containing protein 13-like isoform X2 n=1 Tax=Daphnia pulex TaxID=6669 RepID=UPI001EDE981C|nr:zinc finger CCCH domain-containing protein 13-like isoform X2 [Daphnia pulex]
MSSSSKKNRDGGKKPSVFERLGSKPSSVTEDYCKQWAHKGTCSYSNKCKFLDTHNSKNFKPVTSSGKEGRKKSRSRSPPNRKDLASNKFKAGTKPSSKSADSGEWEKSLEHEDEMALERKLQMLQRELAKQEEQEHKGKAKKPVAKKRERSSSSSSTSSSSSSETSSESSDSSSTSSVTSSSSSSSSSDSDGEVKEKKTKKKVNQVTKRSQSSSSRNQGAKEKAKAKARKIAKLSPVGQVTRKKDPSSANKKQIRNNASPKRQHVPSTSAKHSRDSPTYSTMIRSRSPRVKDPEPPSRDRRQRRSPESSPTEAKRKLTTPVVRRRTDDHSPLRGRSRERKPATSSSTYDVRGKGDKPRDRLLEPGYLVRPRSPVPVYREPYPVRDLSPTGSSYRERARAEPYEPPRRVYSPQPILSKLERKEDLYDSRLRRPASPEPVRRPISGRAKDYPDYEHDWPASDQTKIPDWDHPEFRRRNRPIDDISWNRTLSSTEMSWKKSYSPPPLGNHSYPEQIHSNRNTTWDPLSKSSSRTDDNKRDRERRIGGDGRRSRDSNRRVADPVVKPPTPATRTEELRSPVASEPPTAIVAPKVEEIEETRPSSSAVEVEAEENFSDFSDDVDEILNRDLQDTESVKTEEAVPVEPESEPVKTPTEIELNVNVEPVVQVLDIQPSPKMVSPVVSAIESRSTDEDLLGGMDIEQISDEELEDEARSAPIDALEVDWTSLACKREKKVESGAARARQRWEGKAVLARLGITSREAQSPTSTNVVVDRKPLFDCSTLFRRALSARMDLSFRRSLCNLPVRELVIEYCDDDLSLYKSSVDLLLKDRVLAN